MFNPSLHRVMLAVFCLVSLSSCSDSVTIKGKDASFAGATTVVLVKQNEAWKYVHHHETFIRNSD